MKGAGEMRAVRAQDCGLRHALPHGAPNRSCAGIVAASRLPLGHLSLVPEELAYGSRVHAREDAVAGRELEPARPALCGAAADLSPQRAEIGSAQGVHVGVAQQDQFARKLGFGLGQ